MANKIMNKEKLPKRKNIRLKNYDYSEPGSYFITICTQNKEKLLWDGELEVEKFIWEPVGEHCVLPKGLPLSKNGIVAEQNLKKWNDTYKNVCLSSYVIMPNHLHIIVMILSEKSGSTQCSPTVSRMVKLFKESVTKQFGEKIWQVSFYDHIIRDKHDYEEISKYIYENPLKWEFDELYFDE